ncbi:MAG: hypothetical protein HKO90_03650 [Flavobacteriaceae bacterium]|nr:hypothetical protein [Flavobacteriaceae bacterium]
MAPLKMEEEMKQKLEDRRISPSADAWQRLNDRLDKNERPKPGAYFWWIGLAAACIVLLMLLKTVPESNHNNTIPVIVDTGEEQAEPTLTVGNDPQPSAGEVEDEVKNRIQVKQEALVESINRSEENKAGKRLLKKDSPASGLAQSMKPREEESDDFVEKNKAIINDYENLPETTIADNTNTDANSQEISNAELDDLLEQARKRLNLEEPLKNQEVRVRAQALLDDVEEDLDRSFRERVFKTLVSGFESVKTVVAERNN